MTDALGAFAARLDEVPGAWGVVVRRLDPHPAELLCHDADTILRSASAAKIRVLVAVARLIDAGHADPGDPVDRRRSLRVADSGLWQHLRTDVLPVADAAALVGAVSDNWATNALIDIAGGLARVRELSESLCGGGLQLCDLVRDVRGDGHPETLSVGSAAGYAEAMARLWNARERGDAAAGMVLDWLGLGVDHSMVAGAFGLDPLAHPVPDRGVMLVNKTGTDVGVRVDVGLVRMPRAAYAYACLVNWEPGREDAERDAVLAAMRQLGAAIRAEGGSAR